MRDDEVQKIDWNSRSLVVLLQKKQKQNNNKKTTTTKNHTEQMICSQSLQIRVLTSLPEPSEVVRQRQRETDWDNTRERERGEERERESYNPLESVKSCFDCFERLSNTPERNLFSVGPGLVRRFMSCRSFWLYMFLFFWRSASLIWVLHKWLILVSHVHICFLFHSLPPSVSFFLFYSCWGLPV